MDADEKCQDDCQKHDSSNGRARCRRTLPRMEERPLKSPEKVVKNSLRRQSHATLRDVARALIIAPASEIVGAFPVTRRPHAG